MQSAQSLLLLVLLEVALMQAALGAINCACGVCNSTLACPLDQPLVNCFVSPCAPLGGVARCKSGTTCVTNYCGGCHYTCIRPLAIRATCPTHQTCDCSGAKTGFNCHGTCHLGMPPPSTKAGTPPPLPCCPPVARAGQASCRDCGLRG